MTNLKRHIPFCTLRDVEKDIPVEEDDSKKDNNEDKDKMKYYKRNDDEEKEPITYGQYEMPKDHRSFKPITLRTDYKGGALRKKVKLTPYEKTKASRKISYQVSIWLPNGYDSTNHSTCTENSDQRAV